MATINISDIKDKIAFYAQKHGVDPKLVEGIIRAENSTDPASAVKLTSIRTDAVGPTRTQNGQAINAKGLMQITPAAIAQGVQDGRLDPNKTYDPLNIDDNLDVGAAYIAYGMRRAKGDPLGMARVFNFGRVDANNPETNAYVPKFTAGAGINMPDNSTQYADPTSFAAGARSTSDFASMLLDPDSGLNAAKQGIFDSTMMEPAIRASHQNAQVLGSQAINQGLEASLRHADVTASQGAFQQQLQSIAGLDLTDPNNVYASSLNASMQAHQQYEQERAKYDEMSQKTFWDDPLGTILASVEMPHQAAVVNNLANKQDRADQFLQSRITLLGGAEQTMKANTVTVQQQVDKATAEAKALMAKSELEKANTGTFVQQADRALSRAHAAGQLVTAGVQNDLRLERLDKIKLDQEQEAAINDQLANTSKLLGYSQPVTTKTFNMMSKAEQAVFDYVMRTGTYGPDLGAAVANYLGIVTPHRGQLIATGGAVAYDTAVKISNAMEQEYKKQVIKEAAASGEKLTPQTTIERMGKKFSDAVESALVPDGTTINDLGAAKWDTDYNPYKLNFMAAITALQKIGANGLGTPVPPNNIMYKYLVLRASQGNLLKGDFQSADIKNVLNSIKTDVAAGKIKAADAARDIATFMQAGQDWQTKVQQLPRWGLRTPNGYNYSMPWDHQSIDITSRAAVENALIRGIAADKLSQSSMFNFPKSDSFDFSVFNVPLHN